MSDYGILVEDYFPGLTTARIARNIQDIINKRNELLRDLTRLYNDGVCSGNIVEEYRKVNGKEYGPYYRLTYYTDENGHKPKPDYIPAKDVAEVQRWIDNQAAAVELQQQIDRLEGDLFHARRHIEQLDLFLAGALAGAAGNTKKE